MVTLPMLWLPILLSAVFVFIASNIFWMALPFWHHRDYGKIATSDRIVDALVDTPSGQYMVPSHDWNKLTPEERAAFQKRPGGLLLLRNPMQFSIGSALASFFILNVVIAVFIAYVCRLSLSAGAPHASVFRVAATAGILAYAFNTVSDSIWFGKPWLVTVRFIIDGLIYALLIGTTFAWLWPH